MQRNMRVIVHGGNPIRSDTQSDSGATFICFKRLANLVQIYKPRS